MAELIGKFLSRPPLGVIPSLMRQLITFISLRHNVFNSLDLEYIILKLYLASSQSCWI